MSAIVPPNLVAPNGLVERTNPTNLQWSTSPLLVRSRASLPHSGVARADGRREARLICTIVQLCTTRGPDQERRRTIRTRPKGYQPQTVGIADSYSKGVLLIATRGAALLRRGRACRTRSRRCFSGRPYSAQEAVNDGSQSVAFLGNKLRRRQGLIRCRSCPRDAAVCL